LGILERVLFLHYRIEDILYSVMEVMGIGGFPENAFKVPVTDDDWYYTDWMDT
jgi:hypothetical protein